jgi:hypothetical protein
MIPRVGSPLEYARVQEYGGTIRAKNVRNLTIPLSPLMTGRGAARGAARDVISNPSAFGYRGTFFSAQILFGKREDGSAEPLFKLQPSVTLPAPPYAEPALDQVAPQVESSIARAMEAPAEGLTGGTGFQPGESLFCHPEPDARRRGRVEGSTRSDASSLWRGRTNRFAEILRCAQDDSKKRRHG